MNSTEDSDQLGGFIGLLQLFRRYIKTFSHLAAPLTNLIRKGSRMHRCNEQCTRVFNQLKQTLYCAPTMQSPNWDKPSRRHIDAFALAVRGTLTQLDDDGHDPAVVYFSKRLHQVEENYTATDREPLGLVCL